MNPYLSLPDAIGRPDLPRHRRPRLITPVWGSLPSSFSQITWHFAQAAITEGTLDAAFVLQSKSDLALQASGAMWKAWQRLRRRKHGGYKFSQSFSDLLWRRYLPRLADTVIINDLQIFGELFLRRYAKFNITPCFYIDGTLSEYFNGYTTVEQQTSDPDVLQRAIEMEHNAYRHAARIFTMSRATMRNLAEVYGVPASKMSLLLPGANIDDAAVPPPSPHRGWVGPEFTLGFVGLFPRRKGLDKLAEAVAILRSRRLPIRLRVIGRCPAHIAAMDGIEYLGMIGKGQDTARFVEAIRTVDLGCQLSRAELLGIAMLEFIRVGVPVLATNLGGMPDVLSGDGGVLVSADITAEELAEELGMLVQDAERYQALRQAAVRRAEWASWRRAARELDAGLHGIN